MPKKKQKVLQKAREPTRTRKHPQKIQNTAEKPQKLIREGEVWSINDGKTRGHKSLITKIRHNKKEISHLPTTHSPTTRNMENIKLKKNWDENSSKEAYILPKIQHTRKTSVGAKHPEMFPRDSTDKSIIRHIKKLDKKKKR